MQTFIIQYDHERRGVTQDTFYGSHVEVLREFRKLCRRVDLRQVTVWDKDGLRVANFEVD